MNTVLRIGFCAATIVIRVNTDPRGRVIVFLAGNPAGLYDGKKMAWRLAPLFK